MPSRNKAPGRSKAAVADLGREERTRTARMLHDQVGQVLSAAGLQLELLRMDFEQRIPEVSTRTAEIQQLLERALVHVRALICELNPAPVTGASARAPEETVGRKAD